MKYKVISRNKQVTITKKPKLPIAFCLMLILTTIISCKNSSTETNINNTPPAEPQKEATATTIASLTPEQIKTIGIQYGAIEQKELTATIKANGILKVPNNNKANATSLYGGVIKSLNVQVGSYVKKGQIIATITNPQFLQLQEEYLNLSIHNNSTEAISTSGNTQYATLMLEKKALLPQIEFAEKEYARQKELFEGNAGARKNLEAAESNAKMLKAKLNLINEQVAVLGHTANSTNNIRLQSIKQQLSNMGINPANITPNNLLSSIAVSAPIGGTVSNVFSKIGSYVDVASPVAEIVDNASLHLDLNVFEKDLPLLKVGQTIHFTLTNNPTNEYDAVVYSIGTAFENDSKTIPIHCTVTDNKTGLIDGMNITAIVSLNNVTTPALPNEAIVEAEGKFYIFAVTTPNPAQPENVFFQKIEIIKGVSNVGYTAVNFINNVPNNAKIVTKGAFFINAKLTNVEEEE